MGAVAGSLKNNHDPLKEFDMLLTGIRRQPFWVSAQLWGETALELGPSL